MQLFKKTPLNNSNRSWISWAIASLIIVCLYGWQFNRFEPRVDEGIFLEAAYSLAKHNTFNAPSLENDKNQMGTFFFVHPPLNTVLIGYWLKITPLSLYSARYLETLFTGLSFITFIILMRRLKIDTKRQPWIFLIFASNPLIWFSSSLIRPEMLLVLLILLTCIQIHSYLRNPNIKNSISLGVLVGLSLLTHITSLFLLFYVGFILLKEKRIKPLFYFSLALGITLTPFLIKALKYHEAFYVQMIIDRFNNQNHSPLITLLGRIKSILYTMVNKKVFATTSYLGLYALSKKIKNHADSKILLILSILFITQFLILPNCSPLHFTNLVPIAVLLLGYINIDTKKLLIFFLILFSFQISAIFFKQSRVIPLEFSQINALENQIPKNKKILTTLVLSPHLPQNKKDCLEKITSLFCSTYNSQKLNTLLQQNDILILNPDYLNIEIIKKDLQEVLKEKPFITIKSNINPKKDILIYNLK